MNVGKIHGATVAPAQSVHFGAATAPSATNTTTADASDVKAVTTRPGVPEARFTLEDLGKQLAKITKDGEKKLGWFGHIRMFPSYLRFLKEGLACFRSLPTESKKRIRKYLFSIQFLKDWRNKQEPGLITRKLASYAGPPVGKVLQLLAQNVVYQDEATLTEKIKKLSEELDELKKQASGGGEEVKQKIAFKKMDLREAQHNLKVKQIAGPMLNNVPPLPYQEMESEINKVIAAFEKEHGIKVTSINKTPVGAGTIAQCYEVTLEKPFDGSKKMALKAFRPDVNAQYINEFDNLIYRLIRLAAIGKTKAEQHAVADEAAKQAIQVLKEEIDPPNEQRLARGVAQSFKSTRVNIDVPDIVTTTERGMMIKWVDGINLSDLSTEKLKQVIQDNAPDLQKMGLVQNLHLDAHAGNLRWNEATNRLILLDYGRGATLSNEGFSAIKTLIQDTFGQNGDYSLKISEQGLEKMLALFPNEAAKKAIRENTQIQQAIYIAARDSATGLYPLLTCLAELQATHPAFTSTAFTSKVSAFDIRKAALANSYLSGMNIRDNKAVIEAITKKLAPLYEPWNGTVTSTSTQQVNTSKVTETVESWLKRRLHESSEWAIDRAGHTIKSIFQSEAGKQIIRHLVV